MKKSFYIPKDPRYGFFRLLGCLFLLMGLSGCGQEPLFYHISYEEAPVDPIIQGGPSKIVADNQGNLYVSNGRIFRYTYDDSTKTGSWGIWDETPGKVSDLALVNDIPYAITLNGSDTGLWKKDAAPWTRITNDTGYSFVQSIFGAGDYLFVGARKSGSATDYAILYYKAGDTSNALSLLSAVSGSLSGALEIGGSYYLATEGNGIFEVPQGAISPNSSLITPLSGTEGAHIMALLNDGGKLAASTRKGTILYGDPAALGSFPYGYTFTKALALWEHPKGTKLFLVGIRGSSSANGYREIPLVSGAPGKSGTPGNNIQAPGQGAVEGTTVSNNAKYNSSLEKQVINSIFMAPQEVSTEDNITYPVIFASTQKGGLWVYRDGSWKAQN